MKWHLPKISALVYTLLFVISFIGLSSHDCTAKPKNLNEALEAAARHNDVPQIKRLLQKGAKIDYYDADGMRPLDYAATHNYLAAFKELLNAEAKPTSPHIKSTLITACEANSYPIVQLLSERKVDVNVFDGNVPYQMTPLMYAAQSGNVRLMKLLIDHGADVNLANNPGQTPLMFVKNVASAKLLINHRADVKARTQSDGGSATVLTSAAESNNTDLVKILIDHGADVNDGTGVLGSENVLQIAVSNGNVGMVKLLIAHRVRVNGRPGNDETALETARGKDYLGRPVKNRREIIYLLKQAGEKK